MSPYELFSKLKTVFVKTTTYFLNFRRFVNITNEFKYDGLDTYFINYLLEYT